MSKEFAVVGAVATQLQHEGHWPPNNLNKVMGSDYHYDQNTIANFLVAVQWHLAHGEPPFDFEFNKKFSKAALKLSVADLASKIDEKTS